MQDVIGQLGTTVDKPAPQSAAKRRAKAWFADRVKRGLGARWTEVVRVTPEIAAVLLKKNTRNRRLSPLRVAKLANVMVENRWVLTSQGVAIARDGTLIDGQHRLAAVIESNTTVLLAVTFGCDSEEFLYLDQGAARTAADLLGIGQVKNANVAAGAAALLYIAEHKHRHAVPAYVIQQYASELKQDDFEAAVRCGMNTKKAANPSSAAAAYYYILTRSKQPHKLPTFWHHFATGEMVPNGPILALRRALADKRQLGARVDRSHAVQRAGSIIVAWNKWIGGAKARTPTVWASTISFPHVA